VKSEKKKEKNEEEHIYRLDLLVEKKKRHKVERGVELSILKGDKTKRKTW
jgi:hypothetical protein